MVTNILPLLRKRCLTQTKSVTHNLISPSPNKKRTNEINRKKIIIITIIKQSNYINIINKNNCINDIYQQQLNKQMYHKSTNR